MNQHRTEELIVCLLEALHHKVYKILQYGSTSECRETDIAVLTPYRISADEEARLSNAFAGFNSKYKESVSVIDIDYESFLKWKDTAAVYQEIDRTGVLLWSEEYFAE